MGVGGRGNGNGSDGGIAEQREMLGQDRRLGIDGNDVDVIGSRGLNDGAEMAERVEGSNQVFAPVAGTDNSDFHE